jgi:hypothetical protein
MDGHEPGSNLIYDAGVSSRCGMEVGMAKKSRKKKARRKSAANHGKRPNS